MQLMTADFVKCLACGEVKPRSAFVVRADRNPTTCRQCWEGLYRQRSPETITDADLPKDQSLAHIRQVAAKILKKLDDARSDLQQTHSSSAGEQEDE